MYHRYRRSPQQAMSATRAKMGQLQGQESRVHRDAIGRYAAPRARQRRARQSKHQRRKSPPTVLRSGRAQDRAHGAAQYMLLARLVRLSMSFLRRNGQIALCRLTGRQRRWRSTWQQRSRTRRWRSRDKHSAGHRAEGDQSPDHAYAP